MVKAFILIILMVRVTQYAPYAVDHVVVSQKHTSKKRLFLM